MSTIAYFVDINKRQLAGDFIAVSEYIGEKKCIYFYLKSIQRYPDY